MLKALLLLTPLAIIPIAIGLNVTDTRVCDAFLKSQTDILTYGGNASNYKCVGSALQIQVATIKELDRAQVQAALTNAYCKSQNPFFGSLYKSGVTYDARYSDPYGRTFNITVSKNDCKE